ncbi:MAG: cation:proton antiporter [Myxococcota bacterium]
MGVLAQSVARHLRLPGIVLLLGAGASLGPDGLGWVEPTVLGEGLLTLVELSVAIILFEGGLNLEIRRLRREGEAIRRLVLGGALVTLVGGAAAVRWLLDWDWITALVFGSLVVVTGPTVIGPLVQELRLRPRVATVLEAEGVLIDPVGAILAVLMLEVALAPGADSVRSGTRELLTQVGFGALMGVIGGFLVAWLLRVRRLIPEGYENIAVLASVLLLFQICNEVAAPSGLLAVPIAGVVVGNLRSSVDRDLREFKDQLTILLIGMLFVLLAASVRLDDVVGLGWQGLAVVGALVVAVRPLAVWLATVGTELDWRERLLVAWIAPRGIVAAAVASATAVALERAGVGGGRELLALVFLTIACTVVLAGLTAPLVARLLGQRLPGREGFAILGAQGLGFLLARELREAEMPVVFVDSNPQNCRRAQEEGFTVVYGNALQERTLQRSRVETVGTVIGLTPNQMLNSVFVSRVRDRFSVPRAYVAVEQMEAGLAPELVKEESALVLFDGPLDVERWDVRFRHDDVAVARWIYRGAPEAEEGEDAAASAASATEEERDRYVLLVIRRGGKLELMHAGFALKPGDEVSVAIRLEEQEAAEADLKALGWEPKASEDAAA